MRRLLLGSAALTAMTAAAVAADLPARAPAMAPAPVYAAPIFTWSGFYVGLNAGVGFRSDSERRADYVYADNPNGPLAGWVGPVNTDLAIFGRSRGNDKTGFTGGAQIGYNWQFGSMVVGLEADINYLDHGNNNNGYFIPNVGGSPYDLTVAGGRRGSNWFGTIRPRIGVAFDRTMIYATGGLAYGGGGKGRSYAELTDANGGFVAEWIGAHRSSNNWGWTLGAGVEHAFSHNLSLKLEYLYVDLDRGGHNRLVSPQAGFSNLVGVRNNGGDNSFHVVRAGVNYRFGGPAYSSGPVVAAY